MKDKIFDTILWVLMAAGFALMLWSAWKAAHIENETIYIRTTDTVHDLRLDTVEMIRTDVVKLPIHDTAYRTDTAYCIDSVLVEVPIHQYSFDTTIRHGDTTTIRLEGLISGYHVDVERLTATAEIIRQMPRERRWGIFVGPMIGSGGFGVGAGVGYKIL